MGLLIGQDIYQRLSTDTAPPIVFGVNLKEDARGDWITKDTSIQPASLDLHVGTVYEPGKRDSDLGGVDNPHKSFSLGPGKTVIIGTKERVNFPNTIAAFGFPPSTLSTRGILMTNPGHVDPGYRGHLHFTLINMGQNTLALDSSQIVVTLLLVKLDAEPLKGYSELHSHAQVLKPRSSDLAALSHDFLDFEARAQKISHELISKAELRPKWLALWAGIVTLLLFIVQQYLAARTNDNVQALSERLTRIEAASNLEEVKATIETIKNDLSKQRLAPPQAGN
jgi:deoxycytidine triphosphate deaminase